MKNWSQLIPAIERKGDKVPYTSHNGHMFSYMYSDGTVALRLPDEEIENFLKKYNTTLMKAYGIVQKEYAVIPESLLKKTAELKKYFQLSYRYVNSLKPKATTKKKK